ncbi:retrovirus-related pol polyprotein from transposon TNT 1-94 [Tanacetum coccineum]
MKAYTVLSLIFAVQTCGLTVLTLGLAALTCKEAMLALLREFSVARTPQKKGVAKRRNKTLIEAARTILADSKLPTTFWVEAFNTTYYMQNRVLVVKPYNKTPYELFRGAGPKWLFDIDVLTKSMSYVPVVVGTNSNDFTEPDMFSLGDNATLEATHVDFFGDETEVDMSNITTTYPFGVQTRKMIRTTNEQGFISTVYEDKTHENLQNCLFACLLSQVKPEKNVLDFGYIYPYYKRAIGTKWVYKNKNDERGIVIINKARLVAQGYTQEEGIHYDKVFAPVSRIEAIRLFLAYASFKDFVVYQMDVKSAFLYGKIEEEVYVCQPPGFEDPEFPDKVYKFWKTATARPTLDNGEMEITATIDGKVKIVTEASQGPIIQGEGSTYPVESPTQTNVTDEATSIGVDVRHGGAATTVTSLDAGQGSGNIDKTPTMPHDSPLTKKVYGASFTKLIKKVKKLEKKDKLSKSRRKLRLDFTTANIPVTTAGVEISTASPEVKTAGDSVDDIAAESLVYIRRSAAKTKDKGKGIMEESESAMTKTKRQQEQERLGLETAVRLQEEFDEEERQRIARVHEAARSFSEVEWEDIRARVEASEELVQRLQTEEREKYSEDDQAKMLVDLINQRKRYFAAQKAKAKRNKPMTQAQQRTYMSNYIKHMGNYKLQQLKRLSFDEIKDLFETTMRRANTFVPMETEIRRGVPELVADSSQAAVTESTEAGGTKRAAEEELGQQSSKKQKSDELSQEELQQLMIIVPEEGMNIEALQTKYPIID